MMKKSLKLTTTIKPLLLLILAGMLAIPATAQKFAYVDTEYILGEMKEYKEAQKKLDEIAEKWQKEIEQKYSEVEQLYKAFQAEQVLLTEEMKRQREDEIIEKEKAAKDLQKKKFGYEGELFKKRQELVKPIQDEVYEAIKKVAQAKSYHFIFDKSNGVTMLYADPKYDMSNAVLAHLEVSGSK